MSYRHNQLYVACTLATYLLLSNFNTTTVADDAFVTNTLVLTTVTLIVLRRTKNALAEQAITLRLIGAVVDGFGLQHLTIRICHNLFRWSKTNGNLRKVTLYLIISFKCHFCRIDWEWKVESGSLISLLSLMRLMSLMSLLSLSFGIIHKLIKLINLLNL